MQNAFLNTKKDNLTGCRTQSSRLCRIVLSKVALFLGTILPLLITVGTF